MIVADDIVAKELSDARQRIAKHGAPDMTDMHRLGNVGRPEINYDAPRRLCFGDAEPFISQQIQRLFFDRIRTQCEVDKAGACDAGGFAEIVDIQIRNNFFRESTRIFAHAVFQARERRSSGSHQNADRSPASIHRLRADPRAPKRVTASLQAVIGKYP